MKHFHGKPCPRCHGTLRYVRGEHPCVLCHRERVRTCQKKYPERTKTGQRRKYDRAKKRDPVVFLLRNARARAREKRLDFTITADDVTLPTSCPLLDIPIFSGKCSPTGNSPTNDRRDNSKGYVPGNVWIISHRANTIKSNAEADELLKIALRLQAFKAFT